MNLKWQLAEPKSDKTFRNWQGAFCSILYLIIDMYIKILIRRCTETCESHSIISENMIPY